MSIAEAAIVEHVRALAQRDDLTIGRDTALLELGLLDSINLVGLIQFVEDRFGLRIPDRDIGADLFASPGTLADYVDKRLGATGKLAEKA